MVHKHSRFHTRQHNGGPSRVGGVGSSWDKAQAVLQHYVTVDGQRASTEFNLNPYRYKEGPAQYYSAHCCRFPYKYFAADGARQAFVRQSLRHCGQSTRTLSAAGVHQSFAS